MTDYKYNFSLDYEFRVAGVNDVGTGQEAAAIYHIPEGMPTDSPRNVTTSFQTSDIVEIFYEPPPKESRNGKVGAI